MTYAEKLKDPRWQRMRLEVLQREDFTCQYCGDKESTLHVHHLCYNSKTRNPWDVDDSALMVLCKDCHSVEHAVKKLNPLEKDLFESAFWNAFMHKNYAAMKQLNQIILRHKP